MQALAVSDLALTSRAELWRWWAPARTRAKCQWIVPLGQVGVCVGEYEAFAGAVLRVYVDVPAIMDSPEVTLLTRQRNTSSGRTCSRARGSTKCLGKVVAAAGKALQRTVLRNAGELH